MSWVYILKGEKTGRFYIGSTTDLERRLKQHATGHTSTTRSMGVLKLVLSEQYPTLKEARFVEKRIKALKRRDYIEKMIQDGKILLKVRPRPRRPYGSRGPDPRH